MLFNFWFVHVFEFFFLVLAFIDCSSLRNHFRPFTDVLRKIFESLTRKVWIFYRRKRRQRRFSQTVWNSLQKVTKAAKILADTVWIFYRRQRRERRFSQRRRTKPLFPLL